MTWIFTFVCLCTDNFLPNLVCLRRTILHCNFLQSLLTICMHISCSSICHISFDIWEVRIMSYSVMSASKEQEQENKETISICKLFCTKKIIDPPGWFSGRREIPLSCKSGAEVIEKLPIHCYRGLLDLH